MQSILPTMSKTLEISSALTRRTHRTYSAQFKAELVATCQQPGASIAALAGQHAMNANVPHRWLKDHQRSECHRLVAHSPAAALGMTSSIPAIIPVQLPPATLQPQTQKIKTDLRKGALSMVVTWLVSEAAEFCELGGCDF